MKIIVDRLQKDPDVTIGSVSVDGDYECWSLEDPVRSGPKIYGETAIPAGTYNVTITPSPRFKRDLPLICDVAGFSGIRIHPGNTAADTEGCLLVGNIRLAKSISQSRMAFDKLFIKIRDALARHEKVTIHFT
jgi:hypothetical protein